MAVSGQDDGRHGEILARLDGLNLRVSEIRVDAREARDATTKLTERFDAQDVPKQLAELKGQMEAGFSAGRSDLVNATTQVRTTLTDHDARIKQLEAFRQKLEGGAGVFAWISKHAPWLVAVTLGIAAAAGWKDKLP